MGERRLRTRHLLLASALTLVGACAAPDVEERLNCKLSGDGSAEITFEVTFPDLTENEANEARRERIAALQQYYFEGWDRWAPRFERTGQAGETLSWERVGGSLRRLERSAHFDDPEALSEFFVDTDISVLFTPGLEESELAIFAGSSSRASGEEKERLEKMLAGWSQAAAGYLREVEGLYRYLEDSEGRAEVVFSAIFDDSSEGLHDFEEERLDRLLEAFLAVLEIAEAPDDQGDSLERLARLVYDPFPARLSVEVDGRTSGREGFLELEDGRHEIPPLGLERALGDLEQLWIEPPLLTTYERLQRLGDSAGFDVGEFAARPRRVAELPSAEEIEQAVEEALTPAPVYRLRWRPSGADSVPQAEPGADE